MTDEINDQKKKELLEHERMKKQKTITDFFKY